MHWIDWLIVCMPLLLVAAIGIYTQRYVKGVSDFLSAGRVAGRYVVAVANGEAALGLVSLVAMFEAYYKSGLAYCSWGAIGTPLTMIFLLTGYCTYRYRETRAMTMGQFFEIRYNRAFRVYAGILQSISGILNYAIFPAVGARFLVYFCGLPVNTSIFGWEVPTFMICMAIFLTVAVFIATMGGQITIMTTDCIQGILSYPMYAIVVIYILSQFSWFNDIVPPLLNRPSGKSFLNMFDIHKLRDFNIFYVSVGIFSNIFNRMAWSGTQGYNSAARDAHEQKMGGVLGVWRSGFSLMMYTLLAVCAFVYLNGGQHTHQAAQVRSELAAKAMQDATPSHMAEFNKDYETYLETGEISPAMAEYISLFEEKEKQKRFEIQAAEARLGLAKKQGAADEISPEDMALEKKMADMEVALNVGAKSLNGYGISTEQHVSSRTFKTIFGQMRVPMALKAILPIGITGVFCALCVFLLISTDTTYLHSWGSIIVQDVILPIRGKPFTPRQHLNLLRIIITLVALFAFFFSSFFSQIDFIIMFFAITGAIWLGGAGPCIVGGLYWKRGTAAGAFAALACGSTLAVSGIVLQQLWASHIVPWLEAKELIGTVAIALETASGPFEPYIQWRMNLEKFPINSQELFFFAMLSSLILYIVVSLFTCRKPFNMERMLHRGKYRREGEVLNVSKLTSRNWLIRLVGIDSQYAKGDKAIAWSVFFYSFVWSFGSFLTVVLWNKIFGVWPKKWWGNWYFFTIVCLPSIIGIVSTIWFTWGGTRDLIRMFKALGAKESNVLDDGRVVGNVSADDVELVEVLDNISFPEAHLEEEILREELEEEGDTEDLQNLREHTKDREL